MNNLREIRLSKRATLKEAAEAIGIDPGNLSRIERNQQRVGRDLALKLAEYYGVTPLDVLYPNTESTAA